MTRKGTLREVEPRMSGYIAWQPCTSRLGTGRVVREAQCGPVRPPSPAPSGNDCWDPAADQRTNVVKLVDRPECTEATVARLETLAAMRSDATIWSDLSAAYYVRAQRYDRPLDLLRAFGMARKANARDPDLPEARFNYALAAEALGLDRDAIEAWEIAAHGHEPEWAGESRARRDALRRRRAMEHATIWPLNVQRLPEAARIGDTEAVAQLIKPYPGAAQRHVESTVLAQWADAARRGAHAEAHEQLALANAVATALAGQTGDRYLLDGVEAIERVSGASLFALSKGHSAFEQARRARQALDFESARSLYGVAIRAFASGGSPFALGAELERVGVSVTDAQSAFTELDRIEPTARKLRYGSLWAAARATRATFLAIHGRHLDALDNLEQAARTLQQIGDSDALTRLYMRKASVLQGLGNSDMAWHEVFRAMRYASSATDPRTRELVLGEAGRAALALGHPDAALRFQNERLRAMQHEFSPGLRPQMAATLSDRAAAHLGLLDSDAAMKDLAEAERLAQGSGESYANAHRALRAQAREIEAQKLLPTNARGAVQAYTEALALAGNRYLTFRADLLLQRAAAYRRVNDRGAELADLQSAAEAMRQAEARVLSHRVQSEDPLWARFFSRSDEAFSRVIQQMAANGEAGEAFHYAERRRFLAAPGLYARSDAMEPGRVQSNLPKGTAIVEYEALDDRTLVWVITADRFVVIVHREGRWNLSSLAHALHDAAGRRDAAAVDSQLSRLYSILLQEPLQLLQGASIDRLVIVPDGAFASIPFAALRNPATKRYLVEDYSIAVSDSATRYIGSLLDDRQRARTGQASVLLVETSARNSGELPPLTGAMAEITRIRPLYPDATVLTGSSATVMNFLRLARRSTIIHLAGHAVVDPRMPAETLLLFAPSDTDSGALRAGELLRSAELQQARLVVLASCSTPANPVVNAAPSDLARPFLNAGVPAVLGSVWEVDDVPAAQLLESFHRSYVQGHDAAAALRNAQLQFIATGKDRYSSVFAWAPFELIGHASSPFGRASR